MDQVQQGRVSEALIPGHQFNGRISNDLIKPGFGLLVVGLGKSKNLRVGLYVFAYRDCAC
jgi:hypothetical protein